MSFWRRLRWVRCLCVLDGGYFIKFSSDTYDIYYANPALLPTIQADPAPMSMSSVWTLTDNEPDATVDDICKFIVEYIKSDVMVCPLLSVYTHSETHKFCANCRVC
jgi:hypothetical protein